MGRFAGTTVVAVAAAVAVAGCGAGGDRDRDASAQRARPPVSIAATGATSLAPLLEGWAGPAAAASGVRLAYRPRGARDGLRGLSRHEVVGAGADARLAPRQARALARQDGGLVQIPLAVAPIAVAYNLAGSGSHEIGDGVQLDGLAVAQVFDRTIYNWVRYERIVRLNPHREIVDQLLTLCRRRDPSGETAAIARYAGSSLRARSDAGYWSTSIVRSFDRHGAGDDGVVRCVKRQPAALGYADLADVRQAGLEVAALREAGGRYVLPSAASAAGAHPVYPLTAVVSLAVWRDLCAAGLARESAVAVRAWLVYALGSGQRLAPSLGYAPLPPARLAAARAAVASLTCRGAPLTGS